MGKAKPPSGAPLVPRTGRFTRSADAALEAAVERQVARIGRQITGIVSPDLPFALLLCGGFGRGEGAAELRDGVVAIQNDYDFELIFDMSRIRFAPLYRQLRPRLDCLSRTLAEELGIKQIDIGLKTTAVLRRGPNTIALYELRHGHQLIAGRQEVVDQLPTFPPDAIPMTEGARLLLNRGAGLLIVALYLLKPAEDWQARERENAETELTKAVLASGDVWLLERGRYHYSYSTRAQRLMDAARFSGQARHRELYGQAVAYKLDWTRSVDLRTVQRQWFDTRHLLLGAWRSFEEARLGFSFSGWEEYGRLPKPRHEPALLDLGRCLARPSRIRAGRGRRRRWILDGHEATLLSRLPSLLASATPAMLHPRFAGLGSPATRWVRKAVRFLEWWHPVGEAGRIADEVRKSWAE